MINGSKEMKEKVLELAQFLVRSYNSKIKGTKFREYLLMQIKEDIRTNINNQLKRDFNLTNPKYDLILTAENGILKVDVT